MGFQIVLDRWVVIVTGGRDFTDREAMRARLSKYPAGTLLIHGKAEGADTIAGELGRELHFRPLEEPYFGEAGSFGGTRRNQLLVDIGSAYQANGYTVRVEAFPTPGCTGTWDCVKRAELRCLSVNTGLPENS